MYLKDLSLMNGKATFLSIGWLSSDYTFSIGVASEDFLNRLFELCANPLIKTRGFHECPFCPKLGKPLQCLRNGKSAWLGSGQIRIRGKGKTYEAPNLIYHYVICHNYRPPDEFIEAAIQPRNWLKRMTDRFVFNCQ